jgi:hypothetical protein
VDRPRASRAGPRAPLPYGHGSEGVRGHDGPSLSQKAVAVAGRLADDQHGGVHVAPIEGLVPLARLDFDPVAGFEEVVMMLDLESQFSMQAVEELPRVDMVMPDFASAGRHSFFDYAETRLFD